MYIINYVNRSGSVEKKCNYCKKALNKNYIENKVGYFCNECHYDKYLKRLTWKEYVQLQHSFYVCNN